MPSPTGEGIFIQRLLAPGQLHAHPKHLPRWCTILAPDTVKPGGGPARRHLFRALPALALDCRRWPKRPDAQLSQWRRCPHRRRSPPAGAPGPRRARASYPSARPPGTYYGRKCRGSESWRLRPAPTRPWPRLPGACPAAVALAHIGYVSFDGSFVRAFNRRCSTLALVPKVSQLGA